MYISKVSIVNYRNFANAKFLFNKGINTIIGENGSGKTNLFRAIRLILEDTFYHQAFKLTEGDFNRKLTDWRGHWIIISIEFEEISADESIQALFVHGIGNISDEQESKGEQEKIEKATYNLFFRPNKTIRYRLSELEKGDVDGLNDILNEITITDSYETFFTGKSTADFNDPKVYRELVGDFDNVSFNYKFDYSKYGIKVPHQLSVNKEISFTFIRALRDVVSEFHNNKTNPLLSLLKYKSGEINDADYKSIIKLVDDLNAKIENLPDVQKIRSDIQDTIKEAVGDTYSPSSLSISSSLSSEADKLLQSLRLFIGEPGEDYEGAIYELSLGGANLIFLTLKLLEYKYYKSRETIANFLIIEEPEAHIHTHIQKTLFENLNYEDTQIIYSTHSTHISEVSNIANINILAKKQNWAESYQPSIGLSPIDIKTVQRYLDAIRTNLLFAKGVVLVEGDAEELLVPVIVKKVFGISLDELGISLINIRSTGFQNVAQLFNERRIRKKCSILTDLDTPISSTEIQEDDDNNTIVYKKKMENSSISGVNRKKSLERLVNKNPWLAVFFAKHTFEVDFVSAGNQWEAKQVLEEVYTDKKTIALSKKELDSDEVGIYGKRILTMASNKGKGWLAIAMGEVIFYNCVIPKYVLDAIAFAASGFSQEKMFQIFLYRIDEIIKDGDYSDKNFDELINSLEKLGKKEGSINDILDILRDLEIEDQIFEIANHARI